MTLQTSEKNPSPLVREITALRELGRRLLEPSDVLRRILTSELFVTEFDHQILLNINKNYWKINLLLSI